MGEKDSGSQKKAMVIAYPLGDALYLNITNSCSNACKFCIRGTETGVGYNLWLDREPTVEETVAAIGDPAGYREVVFCGYGEPLARPEVVTEVSRRLKEHGVKVRVNTNGLSDLFLGYDILPQLKGLVDEISISLNASNAAVYAEITRSKFGESAFFAMLEFTRRSVLYIPRVILSVVSYPGVNIEEAARIAKKLGVEFRVRDFQGI
jgi:TatD family-associated radical SAM protein